MPGSARDAPLVETWGVAGTSGAVATWRNRGRVLTTTAAIVDQGSRPDAGPRSALVLLRQRRAGNALRWAAAVSVVLHVGVLAAFLIVADLAGRGVHDAPDAHPMVELVMVEQKGQDKTANQAPPSSDQPSKAPAAPVVPPSPPPTPPSPAPQVAPQAAPQAADAAPAPPPPTPPPAAAADAEVLPPPPPPAPPMPASAVPPSVVPPSAVPPRPAAPPRPPTPPVQEAMQRPPSQAAPAPASIVPPTPNADSVPRVNLGGTDSLTNALAEGDDIIPAGPDPKVHNRDPVYPTEAARRGQEGLVILLIHVSPEGLPAGVDIARSSGFNLLDRAARDAVATWRFVPAVRDGQPIPSSMTLRVRFSLD